MDDLTPEQRKKNMQHIRSKNTEIECILRKALRKIMYSISFLIYFRQIPNIYLCHIFPSFPS